MQKIFEFLLSKEVILPIVYIAVGVIIYLMLKTLLGKVFKIKAKTARAIKKSKTIQILLTNILRYVIGIFVILAILTVYHVDVKSILAGLGIFGLVFGLALQDILKDFLSGISIVLEDQYEIGDTIEVNGFMGEVTFLGLKTTRIRNYTGSVKILSNRNITEVINYNASNSLAIADVEVHYDSDLEEVEQVLKDLAKELTKTLPKIKGEVQLWGVEALKDSGVKYRMAVETYSMEHYGVRREMLKQIKIALDQAGIKIAYPQVEVHHGE